MPNHWGKSRFLLTIAAITVSVLLFACGGERKQTESADVPLRPRVSEASVAVAPPPPAPAPSAAPPANAPRTASVPQPITASAVAESVPENPETDEEVTPTRPIEVGGTRVFSNKDLRRYTKVKEEFGLDRDEVTVDLTPKTEQPDGNTTPVASDISDDKRDEEIRETMKKINELNAEAAYLKTRIPSLHNPYLPRAKVNESDSMAEAGMDNAERLSHVQSRLSQVSSQLDQLQRRLADLHQVEPSPQTP